MPWMPNDTSVSRWETLKFNTKLGKWPKAESARIDAHFRLKHVVGEPFPLASRYVIRLFPFQATTEDFFAFLDLAYRPGTDDFFGTSGLSNEGREVTLTVTQYDPLLDPFRNSRGIMFDFTYQKDGGGIQHAYFFNDVDVFGEFLVPYRPFSLGSTPNWFFFSDGPNGPTDWDHTPIVNGFHWITMSDCYVLEEQEVPGPVAFAEFNNVDAKILFTPAADPSGSRWKIEFDIRRHSDDDIVVLGSTVSLTFQVGFFFTFIRWGNRLINMGSRLPLDVWTTVRFEHGFDADDNTFRVFRDGVPSGTSTANATSRVLDTMGVSIEDIKGNFDLRNLVFTIRSGAGDAILMDFPLDPNACDLGPKGIKGETFNMSLPSCP
jgi:hypothetical protein